MKNNNDKTINDIQENSANPFLKWAGGKTQLLPVIEKSLPDKLKQTGFTYIEPFVGSGALLFRLLSKYPNIEKAIINDINEDLINTYLTIKNSLPELIDVLSEYQSEYHSFESIELKKREYYNYKREVFNLRNESKIVHSAIFIFLNRTCFNGLFRVNKSNSFNVPMGSYKKPTICDPENLKKVSELLQKVEILCGDFVNTIKFAGNNTFFYFDPPYKPITSTSNFNSYSKLEFDDSEQIRLRDFCLKLSESGYDLMLSNSDVKNDSNQNHFFDHLYAGFNIIRVKATRRINSKASRRGELNELLITNYNLPEL